MSDLKRSRSYYEGNSPSEAEPTGLKSRYSKEARDIARYALLIQGTGRPVKRKELSETLGLGTAEVASYITEADQFLKEQFCLHLCPLKNAVPAFDKSSPARDEYVLVSKAFQNRALLARTYPEHYRKDYGIMLFVIIMIVLKDDLVDFEEIYAGFTRSHLHAAQSSTGNDDSGPEIGSGEESQIKESLRASLTRLEAMRAFKTETINDPVTQEKVKKYRIGPYALSILDSRTLRTLILRLHFPEDKSILHTPAGREKYHSVIEILDEKVANAHFQASLTIGDGRPQ